MSHDIEGLLDQMTLAEQVSLLAGADFWETVPIERLGIPAMRVSDGPVGARGTRFDGPASINVPCGTSLAATWNPALVEEVGRLLGRETKMKGASVLLAPTVNLHRTPIGGRNFECMSEDPYLTAHTAVAYVRGVQAEGVACCIKHFVGNDTEFERMSINSVIDERTMRELYLVPFEAAVREAAVMAVMTGYNRINGPFAADSGEIVEDVLRGDWGFDGLVMSDWFGLHSTVDAAVAGVDLEMPGPTRHRGQQLVDAVERGDVDAAIVRQRARNVLTLMSRLGVLDGDGPGPELTDDSADSRALVRRAGAAGMVLLRNEPSRQAGTVLPIQPTGLRRVAVIGPNAAVGQIMGGGSAHVTPTQVSHPLGAITQRLGAHDIEVVHAVGCIINRRLPELDLRLCGDVSIDYFADPADLDRGAAPSASSTTGTLRLMWTADPLGRGGATPEFGVRLRTDITPDVSGTWRFAIESIAPARIVIDDEIVLDNTDVPIGGSFFGTGRGEKVATVELAAGRSHHLVIELRHRGTGMGMGGLNVGAAAPVIGDPLADAVDAAASADLSIVIVGTNDDWESEGWDRDVLDLPGQQDELISSVAAVSAATVVVINAGSPVSMPWLDEVDGVLMAWFPGQALGESLVDVLMGAIEPQGRLPVTFPMRLEDTPAFEHHPGRNGTAQYLEGRLMGYRWYDTVGREPLFAFGHGLGYAQITISAASIVDAHTVDVTLDNTSGRDGVEVVQVYAHRPNRAGLAQDEPAQRLVGFARVEVGAHGTAEAVVHLDPAAYLTWSIEEHAWVPGAGSVELRVGRSSRDVAHVLEVQP
jgi:beta-glucosidase